MAKKCNATIFHLDRPLDGETLKKAVVDAGYTPTALAETLGIGCAHERQDVEVVYRRVRTNSPYNILVQLFWLGRTVPESTLCQMLPKLDIEQFEGVGLLNRQDGTVRANVKLVPFQDLLMASDFGPEIRRKLPTEHVLGVGAASMTLAGLTVRGKVKAVLDLGCGAGIQAFLAAAHADRVIGTDTNPRALEFAAFNAALNAIDGIEWRRGSLYEPVQDQKFDLIVSNPPFVISPESRFIFRDGNLPGDAISEQVVHGAGDRLSEGGFACILFNWHHRDQTDWDTRPKTWVSDTACDTWMISFKSSDPLTYAADWLRECVRKGSADYGRLLDEWMAYYEKLQIGRISAGAIIMRKRSRHTNWFRSWALDRGSYSGSSGDQIERLFAAEDLLESLAEDKQLLDQRLRLDEHHHLEHQLKVEDGRWALASARLHASKGVPFAGNVDMYTANLLALLDGRRTLRQAISELADQTQADPEKLVSACHAAVRKLMQSGFLSPAADSAEDH